jgi:hypothetical protein
VTLKARVQEASITDAHRLLIEKSAQDIRDLEKDLDDREAQLRRAEDDLNL